jgi:hypothetical protein
MSLKIPFNSSIGSSLVEIGGYELNDEKVISKKPQPLVEISYKTTSY